MKYSLWCVLFGHVFLGREFYIKEGVRMVDTGRIGFCNKCGLTKAECGISNEETRS